MSKNAIPGFDGFLFVDIAAVATKVADIRDATLSVEHSVIDSTTHDDAPWMSNIAGLRNWSVSAEALYITGDLAQEEIIDRLLDGATVDLELRPKEGTGLRVWTGLARISSWEQAMPNDDADALSIELTGCGILTDGVQP